MSNNLAKLSQILYEMANPIISEAINVHTTLSNKKPPSKKAFMQLCGRFMKTIESDASKQGERFLYDPQDDDMVDAYYQLYPDMTDEDREGEMIYDCHGFHGRADGVVTYSHHAYYSMRFLAKYLDDENADEWTPEMDIQRYAERLQFLVRKYRLKPTTDSQKVFKAILVKDIKTLQRMAKRDTFAYITVRFQPYMVNSDTALDLTIRFNVPTKETRSYYYYKDEDWFFSSVQYKEVPEGVEFD